MSKDTIDSLREAFSSRGRRISLCSSKNLPSLRLEFESLLEAGTLSPEIFDRYLAGFEYAAPERASTARSVVLVASAIGRSVIDLDLEEGRLETLIPPTYGADEIIEENEAILAPILRGAGCAFARAWVPVKSIAAHTGLARYGMNNVLYFEGMGSFVRLDAWWTELEAEGEFWGQSQRLDRCVSCGLCARACPTGCLSPERFIVDAARCLTFLNEGPEPFPAWLDAAAHNAAVGCLRCQDSCPENRDRVGKNVYRRFSLSRAASERFLEGQSCEGLEAQEAATATAALRASETLGAEAKLGRNLRALVEAKRLSQQTRA
jgi:Uncharacterized Fe-S protein